MCPLRPLPLLHEAPLELLLGNDKLNPVNVLKDSYLPLLIIKYQNHTRGTRVLQSSFLAAKKQL